MAALRICFLGDSLTAGTGDPDCRGWVGRVAAAAAARGHDLTVYNLGIRRETSTEIARRWAAEIAPRLTLRGTGPGHDGRLVFAFGTNDTVVEGGRRRLTLDRSIATAAAMLGEAAALYPTLCIGPAPSADEDHAERVLELSAALAPVCGAVGVPYLPVAALLRTAPAWMDGCREGDGAHPGAAGYALFAGLVEQWPAWRAWLP